MTAPLPGTLDDVCPTCRTRLAKRPQRKTKCKACGSFIYSKRRPQDRAIVLCHEADRDAIEAQWAALEAAKEAAGKETASAALVAALKSSDWQAYIRSIGMLLVYADREEDWPRAFELASISTYFDLVGANDVGFNRDSAMHFVVDFRLQALSDAAEALGYGRYEFARAVRGAMWPTPNPDFADHFAPLPRLTPGEAWDELMARKAR